MFDGAHQLPMVGSVILYQYDTNFSQLMGLALYHLCQHPEYLEPLREEARTVKRNKKEAIDYDQMHLMDSFIKETSRLNPIMISESRCRTFGLPIDHPLVTQPRKVLSPFKFADGTVIPVNNWLLVPSQAIMEDEAYYKDPSTFNGFRFVSKTIPSDRFSGVSTSYTFWGGPKRPW